MGRQRCGTRRDWGGTGARLGREWREWGVGQDWGGGIGREWGGRERGGSGGGSGAVLLCPDHVLIVSQSCCDGVPVLF